MSVGEKWKAGRKRIGYSFVGTPDRHGGCGRGRVRGFTRRSARRLGSYLQDAEADYRVMLTLTYPGGGDWTAAKRHLHAFCERLRRRFGDQAGWSLCWFLEFQRRGAPHFHIFTTHWIDRHELSQIWFEIVGSGDERHLAAGTRAEWLRLGRDGAAAYARKYAAKAEQKILPDMFKNTGLGRWWGVKGLRKTVAATTTYDSKAKMRQSARNYRRLMQSMLERCVIDGQARRYVHDCGVDYYFSEGGAQVEACFAAFCLFKDAIECHSSAPTFQTERSHADSRLKMLLESSAALSRTERARKISKTKQY